MFKLIAATIASSSALTLPSAEMAAEGIKGFHAGYYHGLYNEKLHMADECLDSETEENIGKVLEDLADIKSIGKNMFALVGQLTEIYQDVQVCHFQDPTMDLMAYCKASEGACGLGTVAANMQKQMFAVMGKLTSMGQIFAGLADIDDPAEMRMQLKQVGDGCGVIVRDLTGFEKVSSESDSE